MFINWFGYEKTEAEAIYEAQMEKFRKEVDYAGELLGVAPREEMSLGICIQGNKGFYDMIDFIVGWNKKMVEALEKLNNARTPN
jgi:hypothetical protein